MSFSGTNAVTQTVLRSATVMIGCVGSLIMLPRAMARVVTLPDTGANTDSSVECCCLSDGHAECLQARLRPGIFGGSLGVVAARLVEIAGRGRAELELLLLAAEILLSELEAVGRLVVVVIRLAQVGRVDHRQHLSLADAVAESHFDLEDAAAERCQDGGGARRVGLHDRRQHESRRSRLQRAPQ